MADRPHPVGRREGDVLIMRSITSFLALLLVVFTVSPVFSAEAEWDPRLTRGTLANGLTYILHDTDKPADPFNIRLVVHAGSVDEERPSGIAHMLEHMVFQSNRAHPESIHRYIQQIGWRQGLQVNAVTRETETQYMIRTRPNDALDLRASLALAADLVFGPQLRAEDWAKERFVILEELRQGDSAADRLSRQKKAALRIGSRYVDRPTIGTRESIAATSIEEIRAFYDRFYTASNMTLIVSGNIDSADAEKAIGQLFGKAPDRPKPDRSYLALPLKAGLSVGLVQDPAGSSSQTTYAFRMPMPDRISEDGQFAYLQKYLLTRLIRDAVQKQAPHYADKVRSLGFIAQETTERRLVLAFNAGGENHAAALPILVEVIERLRREGISQRAFDAAIASARRVNGNNVDAAAQRTYAEWEDRITSAVLMASVLDDPSIRSQRTRALLDRITLDGLQAKMREMLSSPDQVLFYQVRGGREFSLPAAPAVEAMREAFAQRETLPDLPALAAPRNAAEEKTPIWPSDVDVSRAGTLLSERALTNPNLQEWSLSNGDKVVWLVRDTPDGKVYLSGQSAPGFMNAEFGSTISQLAVQLWAQSGYRFWTQEEYDRWDGAQPTGSRWSYAVKPGTLDVAVASTPQALPSLLQRYARDIAFGVVREEAVTGVKDEGFDDNPSPDAYGQLLYQKSDTPLADVMASMDAARLTEAAQALFRQPVTWFAVGPEPKSGVREAFAGIIGAVSRDKSLTSEPLLQKAGVHTARVENGSTDRARVQISFYTPMNWTPEASFLVSALTPVAQQALKNELRYRLGGIYTLQFEMELDAATNRAIGSLSFYCAPERAQELADAAIDVFGHMPEKAAGADIARMRADIDFAETGRLNDPNTWLRRLALSYRRYGDAGYLTRMQGLGDKVTANLLRKHAATLFDTTNVAILTLTPNP